MKMNLNVLSNHFDQIIETIQAKLDQLPPRDRFAIIILTIFLTVTAIGLMLWFSHSSAEKQQKRLVEMKETIHWMQSNAVKMSNQSAEMTTARDKVQRVSQQLGLSVQSQESNNQLKLIVSHQNYAVLGNFLTQLAQQGVTIVSLDMQKQPSGEIQLSTTVQ